MKQAMTSFTTKYIEIQGVEQTFKTKKGPFCALKDINLTVASGRVRRADRPLGLRQVHPAQPDRRPDDAHFRAACCAPTARSAAPGPERAVVFQNHSLLPWLTCFDNVYLAVERVFGGHRKQGAAQGPAPMRRWPWWA
jgi:nitrate/nitrite transport system ATP-binding protein